MHWYAYDQYILSLDISTQVFYRFEFSPNHGTDIDQIENTEDMHNISWSYMIPLPLSSIPINIPMNSSFLDVWLMKEYCKKESWTKQYSIGPLLGIMRPIKIWKNKPILPERIVQGEVENTYLYEVQLAACDLFNCKQLLEYNVYGI